MVKLLITRPQRGALTADVNLYLNDVVVKPDRGEWKKGNILTFTNYLGARIKVFQQLGEERKKK